MNIPFAKRLDNVAEQFSFNLESLIDTRLLITANSGGGKSYVIRKLLEVSHGHVQQIVLDLEGEFQTLREKYPYILAGKSGDIQTDIKTAELLARKVLELRTSIIIDLYELKQQERKRYVRLFLDSMINAPKDLWHPCIVIVDEAHVLCPEKGESEAMSSVTDLMTRGRKRGYMGCLATQRLSKLHKDAAAEANNIIIGRTGLDIDQRRASDMLGFTSKDQMRSLRDLEPGQFYVFGPSLSREVTKIKVDPVVTTHPKSGSRILISTPPPPSPKIKEVLSKLSDLPQSAEKELKDRESMLSEIRSLRIRIRELESGKLIDTVSMDKARLEGYKRAKITYDRNVKTYVVHINQLVSLINKIMNGLQSIDVPLSKIRTLTIPKLPEIKEESISVFESHIPKVIPEIAKPVGSSFIQKNTMLTDSENTTVDKPLREGAMRMLKAVVMFHPRPVSRIQIATLSGFSVSGGTFNTYFGELRRKGWISESNDKIIATTEGLQAAGDVSQLPTDPELLVDMWAAKFRSGSANMLRVIVSKYPNTITRQDLASELAMSYAGGTFNTYLGELRRNDLIKIEGDDISASPFLFLRDDVM